MSDDAELWSLRNEVGCLRVDLDNMAKARERQETCIKELKVTIAVLEDKIAQHERVSGTIWERR